MEENTYIYVCREMEEYCDPKEKFATTDEEIAKAWVAKFPPRFDYTRWNDYITLRIKNTLDKS